MRCSAAAADKSVVGIVVTGAGRAFCAGADMNLLSGIAAGGEDGGVASEPDGERPPASEPEGDFAGRFPSLMAIDKPIIAAVNGAVAGMAYPFVLCCDLRVVTPDALFLTAFAQRGLIAEWGLSWVLPATRRAGGGARPAVLVAAGEGRRGARSRPRQLPRPAGGAARLLPQLHRRPGDEVLTRLDGGDEAPGVRATPRRARPRRARGAAADDGELRTGPTSRKACARSSRSDRPSSPASATEHDRDGGLVAPHVMVNN